MYFVYILGSFKDGKLYIGFTQEIWNRLKEHSDGEVRSTKFRRPLKLIYYEAYLSIVDTQNRERFFKSGWGRVYINKNLKHTLRLFAKLRENNRDR